MSEEEVRHWLVPRQNVVYSYVCCDPATNQITDMVSYYDLSSHVLGNTKYD